MTEEAAERYLLTAARMRQDAAEEYQEAIRECVKNRISNVKMAAIVGVSETAIRMYRKRHGL